MPMAAHECHGSRCKRWINSTVLIDYWQGAISTVELIQRLQRLP